MHIVVTTLQGDRYELEVEAGVMVLDVKEKLHELVALRSDRQRLLLGRCELDNDQTLEQCGVEDGCRLTLLLTVPTQYEEATDTALIMDCGSLNSRAGFSGSDEPWRVVPTIVGTPKHPSLMMGLYQKDAYVGEEAQRKRGILTLRYPMERGIVANWDHMEKIWHHSFYNELRADPAEHPVLLTEAPLNPKANRSKMVQIMFETFNVPSLHVASQPVLALQHESNPATTGLVLEMGHTITRIVPVYEGYVVAHGITSLDIGGMHLTEHLRKLMCERGYSFQTAGERHLVEDIKEKLCHVATHFDNALECLAEEKSYELPDGQVIAIGSELFRCPEILFTPAHMGREGQGIVDLLSKSIGQCEKAMRPQLSRNIVLSGGTSLLPGIQARIEEDLLARSDSKVRVVAPPWRHHGSWIGGSILASRKAFQESWMKKSDYDEHGPDLVESWPEKPP